MVTANAFMQDFSGDALCTFGDDDSDLTCLRNVDSFQGIAEEPQSLHKYLYAHANPVMNADPSGELIGGLAGAIISASISIGKRSFNAGVNLWARSKAISVAQYGAMAAGGTIEGTLNLTFGPQDLAPTSRFAIGFVGGAVGAAIAFRHPHIATPFTTAFINSANATFSKEKFTFKRLGWILGKSAVSAAAGTSIHVSDMMGIVNSLEKVWLSVVSSELISLSDGLLDYYGVRP